MTAREAAVLLGADSVQMSQIESGTVGVSAKRVRHMAANYGCTDGALIDVLAAMATDRTRGWWEEYRGVLPQVNLDVAELEHHATYLRDVVITRIPGLLQTADYARAVFAYMNPGMSNSEVETKVEYRMRRRTAIEGANATPYEAIVHEMALRLRVSDRGASRVQLRQILDLMEQGRATVRVIPTDQDGFAGSGASMMYAGGPVPQLDTGMRDSPTGVAFIDNEAQLNQLRALIRRLESASLDPVASRDFIHRVAKEL